MDGSTCALGYVRMGCAEWSGRPGNGAYPARKAACSPAAASRGTTYILGDERGRGAPGTSSEKATVPPAHFQPRTDSPVVVSSIGVARSAGRCFFRPRSVPISQFTARRIPS